MSLQGLRFRLLSVGLLFICQAGLQGQAPNFPSNQHDTGLVEVYPVSLARPMLTLDDPVETAPEPVFEVPNPQGGQTQSRDRQGFGPQQSIVTEAIEGPLAESLAPLQSRELTLRVQAVSISNDSIGTGLLPEPSRPSWPDEVAELDEIGRGEMYTNVFWQASLIQHHPLYFEDAMLERHGHTRCCFGLECTQSLVSGAKFFGTLFVMPYLRTLQPKHQCVYALGHYRAGSGAPCLRSNLPYDKQAAIVESASAATFFWAAPL